MASTKNALHRWFGIAAEEHATGEGNVLEEHVNLQIINLGLPRTGTTSFDAAMKILGYTPTHGGIDILREPKRTEQWITLAKDRNMDYREGNTDKNQADRSRRLRALMQGYRSCSDHPTCQNPAAMYAAFPDAKYVLGVRENSTVWFKSFHELIGQWHLQTDTLKYKVFRFLISSTSFIRRAEDLIQQSNENWKLRWGPDYYGESMYDRHNNEVRKIIPKDQLLEFDVRDGWKPLCEFLKVPVPDMPFPRLNEKDSMYKLYYGLQAYGALWWMIYAAMAAAPVYLAVRPDLARCLLHTVLSRTGLAGSLSV